MDTMVRVGAPSTLPVVGVVGAGVVHADDDEHVLEVGADVLRGEGQRSRLLEDYCDDVVTYVPLPQELREKKEKGGVSERGRHRAQMNMSEPELAHGLT